MKPHKWHKEIKAWADGAEIEYGFAINKTPEWFDDDDNPCWDDDTLVFRIKPQPKELQYLYVYQGIGELVLETSNTIVSNMKRIGKIKLEVDDDTSGT
jgi:hypothetical protein